MRVRLPRVRVTVRRLMIAVAALAVALGGLFSLWKYAHHLGWKAHRSYLGREWAREDALGRQYQSLAREAGRRNDGEAAAYYEGEARSAAGRKREVEGLIREFDRIMGEIGPPQPD